MEFSGCYSDGLLSGAVLISENAKDVKSENNLFENNHPILQFIRVVSNNKRVIIQSLNDTIKDNSAGLF